jgi:hypothetical protein
MRIIYEKDGGGFAVVTPAPGVTDLEALAATVVPQGKEYQIVEEADIPVADPTDEQINSERTRRLLMGATVSVTNVGDIPLQGRSEDQINMLGLKDTARDLILAGIDEPVIPFRDAANVVHMLTAMQMIEAIDKGKQYVTQVYQAAWALKELDPIPADFDDDKYWP